MTVIVFDGKTLATDSQGTAGSTKYTVVKILKGKNHVYALAGDTATAQEMFSALESGKPKENWPTFRENFGTTLVSINRVSRRVLCYYNHSHEGVETLGPSAWGSGREYALAGLHLDRTAVECVKVAIALDPNCGGRIQSVAF